MKARNSLGGWLFSALYMLENQSKLNPYFTFLC